MSSIPVQLIAQPLSLVKDSKQDQLATIIMSHVAKVFIKRDIITPQIAHYCATLIENLVVKADKIDKRQLFCIVFKMIMPSITDEELDSAMKVVEYLLEIKMIRRIPILRRSLFYSYEIFKKYAKFFL